MLYRHNTASLSLSVFSRALQTTAVQDSALSLPSVLTILLSSWFCAQLLPSAGKDGGAEAEMSAPSDPCQAVGGIGDASRPGFCCAKECGSCGGKDCGGQPGGEDKCCTSGIEQSGRSCGSDRAPCAVQDAALDTDAGAGAGCLFARTEALK